MKETFSPKQVARALDVSESSLKRWCDRGLIGTVKTAGGHRRIALASIVAFVRESERSLARPELLGLPPISGSGKEVVAETAKHFANALRRSDHEVCRRLVLESFVSGETLAELFDAVLAPAMRQVGDLWECHDLEIYEERVACDICTRIIDECRLLIPTPPPTAPVALGATPAGDPYTLATRMAECVARESGWRATSLGANLPFKTILKAVEKRNPRLLWLSVSAIDDSAAFLRQYELFQQHLPPSLAIVVGGRALTEECRRQMRFSAYCDTFQQMRSMSRSLLASIQEPQSDQDDTHQP